MSAVTMFGPGRPRSAPRILRLLPPAFALLSLALLIALAPLSLASASVFVVAFAIASLLEPALGLVALALLIPWGRLISLPIPVAGTVDILVGVVVVTWLARGVVRRGIMFQTPALTWPLLAFVWVIGLSLTQAFSWSEGLPEWLKWVEFAVLYIVGTQVLGPRSARWLIAALLLTGLSQAALGAYQFLRQVGPEGFILLGRFMRAYGTLDQPNPYAGYLGYLAPAAASLALAGLGIWWRTRQTRPLLIGATCGTVALALIAGIVMSWSRGAWLGLAAALLAVVALRSRRTFMLASTGVLLVLLGLVLFGAGWLPESIQGRVVDLGGYVNPPDPSRTEITDENFSVLERLAHWRAGWCMFESAPWLGVGIGGYSVTYPRCPQPHWYEPLGHAHNVFINFLAETGVLGLGTFLAFWLALALYLVRLSRTSDSPWAKATALGLLGTWSYLTVHSVFDNLFVQHLQLQLALLLAALPAIAQPASGRTHSRRALEPAVAGAI